MITRDDILLFTLAFGGTLAVLALLGEPIGSIAIYSLLTLCALTGGLYLDAKRPMEEGESL